MSLRHIYFKIVKYISIAGCKIALAVSFLFCLVVLYPGNALAGDGALYISPPSGNYSIGDEISMDVFVEGAGEPVGGAEGTITFNTDIFQITAISQAESIFSYWTVEPVYSNERGEIKFAGGASSSSIVARGKLFTFTGRVSQVGRLEILFQSGAVVAFDGKGTNIIKEMTGAVMAIAAKSSLPREEVSLTPATTPAITSLTHPDQVLWYSRTNAAVLWDLPIYTLEVRVGLDQDPNGTPTEGQTAETNERVLGSLSDGVWYFHVQVRTAAGWSPIGSFRFQIDTSPPESLQISYGRGDDGSHQFKFDSRDGVSGISKYLISIDGGEEEEWQDNDASLYIVKEIPFGHRKMTVRAVDRAGNMLVQDYEFDVALVESASSLSSNSEQSLGLATILSGFTDAMSLPVLSALAGLALLTVGFLRILKTKRRAREEKEVNATLSMLSGDLNEQYEMLKTVSGHRPLTREEDILMSYMNRKVKELEE